VDLYLGRIVAGDEAEMAAQLVVDAIVMAVWRRGIHESCCITRPGQSVHERGLPAAAVVTGIVCSMSRMGVCWDNAAMECFF